ncbi:MAG: translocation/assembly module TamB domain-containing protein [Deltaproteobacteria bacterium]|nr:translocation/assembly module TamB domain-containing protein [Deltaproteobacteria bacterium]
MAGRFTEWYNSRISGEISIGELNGTFADGLTLKHITGRTSTDEEVLRIGELHLRILPLHLFQKKITIETFRISHVDVSASSREQPFALADLLIARERTSRTETNLLIPALPVILDAPNIQLENMNLSLVLTNGAPAKIGLDTLSCAIEWHRKLTINVQRLKGRGIWRQQNFYFHIDDAHRIELENDQLNTALEVRADWGKIRLILTAALSKGMKSGIRYEVVVPSLKKMLGKSHWPVILDGRIKGGGALSVEFDSAGQPVILSEFSCQDCEMQPFGKTGFKFDAKLKSNVINANVYLEQDDMLLSGSYNGDLHGHGKVRYAANGKISPNVAGHFGITGHVETLSANGECYLDIESTCNASLKLRDGAYDKLSALAAEAELNAAFGKNITALDGTVTLDDFRAGNKSFRQVRAGGTYDGTEAQLSFRVLQGKVGAASADVRVSIGEDITVNIDHINSSLSDLQLKTMAPFRLLVTSNAVRSMSPIDLQINGAGVLIEQFERKQDLLNGKVAISNVEMKQFNPYFSEPITGTLEGSMTVSGTLQNPSIQLTLNATDLIFRDISFSTLSVQGELKNKHLLLNVDGAGKGARAISVTGTIPIRLNLKNGDYRILRNRPASAKWTFSRLDHVWVEKFGQLPHGLKIFLDGSGELNVSGSQLEMLGELKGNISHSSIGDMEIQLAHEIRSDSQTLHIETVDRQGNPVAIDVASTLNMDGILNSKYAGGGVDVTASIGDSKLGLQAKLDDSIIHMHATAHRFSLATIGAYLNMENLDGHIDGDIKFSYDPLTQNIHPVSDSGWHLDLVVEHLSPDQFPHWHIDLGLLRFDASLTAALLCDGHEISGSGQLGGWLGDGALIRFPAHLNFDVRQKSQALNAEWLMPNGVPAKLELSGTLNIGTISKTKFEPHQWQALLNWGDAATSVTAFVTDMQNIKVKYQIRNFSPVLLRPMVMLEGLDGVLSARGGLVLSNGVFSGTTEITATDAVIGDWTMRHLRLTGQYGNETLKMDLSGEHPYGKDFHLNAKIPLRIDVKTRDIVWQSNREHFLYWKIPPVNFYPFRHLLGISDIFDITLGTDGRISGNAEKFKVTSKIGGSIGAAGMMPVFLDGQLVANHHTQELKLSVVQRGQEQSAFFMETVASPSNLMTGRQVWSNIPVSARLQINAIELQLLELLSIPAMSRFGGKAVAKVDVTGTLGAPIMVGRLKLQDGQFSITGLANRIHGVNGEFRLKGKKIAIPWFKFRSARGSGSLVGNAQFNSQGLEGRGRLKMSRFPVSLAGLPRFIVDLKSDATFRLDRDRFDLDVTMKNTLLTKPAEERNAARFVPTNSNVTVRNSFDENETVEDLSNYRIHLKSESPILVKGRDLNTAWKANLILARNDGVSQVEGSIDAAGGTFNLFQNSFAIERGELTIADAPGNGAFLQLESSSNISSYTVYLNVSGNLLHPRLTLSSSPALTEEQILTLLVSGSTEEDAETSTGAITNLLAVQYPGIHNLLYNRFGISQLRVETTEQGSTALKAGKRVTDRSTVYTVVNANPAKNENDLELQVEIDLTDKTSVGTAVGKNSSSIGIYRRFVLPNREKRPVVIPRRLRDRERE